MTNLVDWAERGWITDGLLRIGMRRLLLKRLKQDRVNATAAGKADFVESMIASDLAVATTDANHQHYEVPTEVFQRMLGPHLKYSCALFDQVDTPLAEAELAMLRLTAERAQLMAGQRILEVGLRLGFVDIVYGRRIP